MAKIHIPTPIITVESVVAYASSGETDWEREEKKIQQDEAEFEQACEQVKSQMPDFDLPSNYKTIDGDYIPQGVLVAFGMLPADTTVQLYVRCSSCFYEKPIYTPCGLPCV